jgi:hypothetical protein
MTFTIEVSDQLVIAVQVALVFLVPLAYFAVCIMVGHRTFAWAMTRRGNLGLANLLTVPAALFWPAWVLGVGVFGFFWAIRHVLKKRCDE